MDFSANLERFSGFADLYDKYRPTPPEVLASILTQIAQTLRPELVVDLGSGTGLSTRYWADQAGQVIGIEPTADMRAHAAAQSTGTNVSYREGFSHQTGLPDGCAQLVTCSQALHWIEPQSTFEEARRILVPGGVFAAFDYDWPPTTRDWRAEQAFEDCLVKVAEAERNLGLERSLKHWNKDAHLERMQASGCFRYTQEITVHHRDQGNAERFIGLLLSQGGVMSVLKNGVSEREAGIEEFRETVTRVLGVQKQTWYWSSRVRYGIV